MHLMVYAPYGRTGVYMLQAFCRRLGIVASDDGIADLQRALEALPPGHPLETLLREAPDFRHPAALADALLHPRDRAYSVPELFEYIEGAGLTFCRWLKQAPYAARLRRHRAATAGHPNRGPAARGAVRRRRALSRDDGRHSVIVRRDDAPHVTFER